MLTTVQKERLATLVSTLRSGKYKQTTGVLRDSDGFCCLGVACDISGLGEWGAGPSMYVYLGSSTILTERVQEYFGLYHPQGIMWGKYSDDPTTLETLTTLNDNGKSFEEIADRIEQWVNKQEVVNKQVIE